MRMIRMVRACVSKPGPAFATPAAENITGAYDNSDIPSFAGSSIVYFDRTEFDRATIPVGLQEGDTIESRKMPEGEVLKLSHRFDNPDISTPQIKRTDIDASEGHAQNRRLEPVEIHR